MSARQESVAPRAAELALLTNLYKAPLFSLTSLDSCPWLCVAGIRVQTVGKRDGEALHLKELQPAECMNFSVSPGTV